MMLDLSRIRDAVSYEGGISRRLFLAYGAALAAIPAQSGKTEGRTLNRLAFADNPFALGVASGEPTDSGVVLWTRLAPRPLEADGGMPAEKLKLTWEVADDEGMKKIVQTGDITVGPDSAHAGHVEVNGLKPDRWYWYRFRSGDADSPIGRTRTMPPRESLPEKLRFAFASCQHFEHGLFTSYEHMAKEDLDLVVHLGDYIYEGAGKDKLVRKHLGRKITSLDDYRVRHAQYRSDPLLSGMHARCPWVVTWDDHEFENNYAAGVPQYKETDPAAFLEQRAHAYQAYFEMMPLRKESVPQGPNMKLYRTVPFGRLAEFQVLDTRQYRTDQPNGDKAADLNADAMNPNNTLLGGEQRRWLEKALTASAGTWNILAQQVMMGMVDRAAGPERRYSMDQWPGAAAERIKLVQFMADRKIANPVVLTGDIHSNWVNDLRVDDRKLNTRIVATEFVGTSISSGGNGADKAKTQDDMLKENPFIRFHNRNRGYVSCTVTPKQWKSDYIVIDDVLKPGGKSSVRASFVVEAGKPGAKPA